LDILLLEPLAPEAVSWLEIRHSVACRPELALDLVALRKEAYKTRAIVFPRHTKVTRELLDFLPKLKAIGRLIGGMDNTDLDFCKERGIKVIYAGSSHVRSNAEYLLSSLLQLYRRGPAAAVAGARPASLPSARELHGSTVGMLGLSPVAHALAGMLSSLGVRLIGYDPAVHHTSPIWERLRIQPVALPELMSKSDAVSVQMLDVARFKGFVNDKLLAACKRHQLWVGISRRALFDEGALAAALNDGRIEACILDGDEASLPGAESPLSGLRNLFLTPGLGWQTREASLRSCWYVSHRIAEALTTHHTGPDLLPSAPVPLHARAAVGPSDWPQS
jgi:phosphoglycerate dehydrogenase-like enzyme